MIDIKVGKNTKQEDTSTKKTPENATTPDYQNVIKQNELKYIREYIEFYYNKTKEYTKRTNTLLTIVAILLVMNLLPSIIKFFAIIILTQ